MAAKKPLANYAGTLKELQTGDTVTGLGGTLIAYKANGTQDNIDLLDGVGITVLPIAQGGTGAATGPAALISLGAREVLTAARTYYVRTDGSNSNTGLANTAGGAFLTIQKAVDVVCSLDTSVYQVTIQVADGTYTGAVVLGAYLGSLSPIVQGNAATPANCLVSRATGICISLAAPAAWSISGFKITNTSGTGIQLNNPGATLAASAMDYGACSASQISVYAGAMTANGSYTISGSSPTHVIAQGSGSNFTALSLTVTLTGTPAFSTAFVYAAGLAASIFYLITFSGSATGSRYNISMNSIVNTYGCGANYLPGNSAGATATGGQYA